MDNKNEILTLIKEGYNFVKTYNIYIDRIIQESSKLNNDFAKIADPKKNEVVVITGTMTTVPT